MENQSPSPTRGVRTMPFFLGGGGGSVPTEHEVVWADAYLHTKWHFSTSSHLVTTDIGQKLRGYAPLGEGHLTQCRLGWGLQPEQVASWYIQTFSHNRHGLKIGGSTPILGRGAVSPSNTRLPGPKPTSIPSGILIHSAIWPQQIWAENWGLCPFGGGGAGSPSNTMWPGPRPTCTPSFIFIHPTVWRQYTNVADWQRGQYWQWSDSIGWTMLQMVTQKWHRHCKGILCFPKRTLYCFHR